MRFGMNVSVTDTEGGADFIRTCDKAGLKAVRLVVTGNASLNAEIEALVATKAKAVLSLYRIEPATAAAASATFDVESNFQEIVELYRTRCGELPVTRSLGVNLPEGMHYILRVGKAKTKFGLLREQIIARMNTLADVIRKAGHKVVLPARIEDITGLAWHGFNCDVIDIEMMMAKRLDSDHLLQDALSKLAVPFWFGKAGVMGGYIMPAEQSKFIRKLAGMKLGAEYAFLWSERRSPRWEWSCDGKTLVEILGEAAFAVPQVQPQGSPVVAEWKSRQRETART